MEITFTDNMTINLLQVLKQKLSEADEVKFGVAFVRYSGYSLIEDAIKHCLENEGKVEFILGLDFRTTEPRILRLLSKMAKSDTNLNLFCFSDPSTDDTPIYHPKIYLLREGERVVISIGSSNLTAGGLKDNVEVNAVIEANIKEEVVSDIYGVYNRLKFQKDRFEPDLAYIEQYEEAYEIVQRKSKEALKEKNTEDRIKKLKEREKDLPKPEPRRVELFGWQKLVYEKLPKGTFRTSDMYIYEREFQKIYSENKHIKDKIRQILQQLRDIGLLKHLGREEWEKV